MLSFFVALYLFGDHFFPYYKKLGFIFIKVLQSFFRGTLDNSDYDPDMDRYGDFGEERSGSFWYYIRTARTPLFRIIAKVGSTGYLVVR
jgi:hypothetical protein